ncbi:hypothetical protein NDN08_002244 [Rhodosorus marinus]|uniref:TPM domain-containing protein n=1 Tax=Rhodosorus marinus TaxID=101924 RepID=A0AAV8UUL4_9RHOD|nr:hypothetical protein NDN08_002244 [Rhodosorus marinus]
MLGFVGYEFVRLRRRLEENRCAGSKATVRAGLDHGRRLAAAGLVASVLLGGSPVAFAVDPVLDYGRALTTGEKARLITDLQDFEEKTGYRIRVLVQKPTGVLTEPKTIWPVDENTVVVLADPKTGNLLDFRIGRNVSKKLTQTFWLELQSRYGNMFYVKDNGADRAILGAIGDIKTCMMRPEGCVQVPGYSRDQFALSAIITAVAGAVAGLAPRQGGKKAFDVAWLVVFSPFWGFLLAAFGIGPIVQREGWLNADLGANLAIFFGVAVISYFGSARVFPPQEDSEQT